MSVLLTRDIDAPRYFAYIAASDARVRGAVSDARSKER